jgi:menaquinone-dependent protoporphyrinogen IX oxidase
MERKHVICPETRRGEDVTLESTPSGVVITGCSRFSPGDAVTCGRGCAVHIDRAERSLGDDRAERVLVLFASTYGQTSAIASAITDDLAHDGLTVELAEASKGMLPPPADYDAVVIAAPIELGRHPRFVIDYIARYRTTLAAMPAFFISVCNAAGRDRSPDPNGYIARMTRLTGWVPTASVAIGGALAYSKYRWWVRWFMKLIGRATGVKDTSRDHVFTDWAQVHAFARQIGEDIPAAEVAAPELVTH